jgi:hypothetical protein
MQDTRAQPTHPPQEPNEWENLSLQLSGKCNDILYTYNIIQRTAFYVLYAVSWYSRWYKAITIALVDSYPC